MSPRDRQAAIGDDRAGVSDIDAGGLRSVRATRYVHPLREGGSLPALIEVDGGDLFVAKWRGASSG